MKKPKKQEVSDVFYVHNEDNIGTFYYIPQAPQGKTTSPTLKDYNNVY